MSVSPLTPKDQWTRESKRYVVKPPMSRRPRGGPKIYRIRNPEERAVGAVSKRIQK